VGFHGSAEGVFLQPGSCDCLVNIEQFANGELGAQEVLGIGEVGIPSS
jgi:hypothetical protein